MTKFGGTLDTEPKLLSQEQRIEMRRKHYELQDAQKAFAAYVRLRTIIEEKDLDDLETYRMFCTTAGRIAFVFPRGCQLGIRNCVELALYDMEVKVARVIPVERRFDAYTGEEPWASKARSVTCKGCNKMTCPLNPLGPGLQFRKLSGGNALERERKGEAYLGRLISSTDREHLSWVCDFFRAHNTSSRKYAAFTLHFKKGEDELRISLRESPVDIVLYVGRDCTVIEGDPDAALKAAVSEAVVRFLAY